MKNLQKISLIIPAHNEALRIRDTLQKTIAFSYAHPYIDEIVVVDDGSTDTTLSILKEYEHDPKIMIVHYPKNQGKGYAVKEGMRAAKGDAVIFMDADLSTPLREIQKLLATSSPVVIGSRKKGIQPHYPTRQHVRSTMSTIGMAVRKLFLLRTINDTQCGFKYFTKDACQHILAHSTVNGYAFDIEFLTIMRDNNFTIKEIGVAWSHVPTGHLEHPSSILRAIRHIMGAIVVIWTKSFLGHYTRNKSI